MIPIPQLSDMFLSQYLDHGSQPWQLTANHWERMPQPFPSPTSCQTKRLGAIDALTTGAITTGEVTTLLPTRAQRKPYGLFTYYGLVGNGGNSTT